MIQMIAPEARKATITVSRVDIVGCLSTRTKDKTSTSYSVRWPCLTDFTPEAVEVTGAGESERVEDSLQI